MEPTTRRPRRDRPIRDDHMVPRDDRNERPPARSRRRRHVGRRDLYFTSSDTTKKSKDLSANPFASISVSLDGIDLVFEGKAERVTDRSTLETVTSRYREGGWPATVEGDAVTAPFSAPSAGPPPWNLYRLAFERVIGVASAEPNGATTWRFT